MCLEESRPVQLSVHKFLFNNDAQHHDHKYIIEMGNGNHTVKLFIAVVVRV